MSDPNSATPPTPPTPRFRPADDVVAAAASTSGSAPPAPPAAPAPQPPAGTAASPGVQTPPPFRPASSYTYAAPNQGAQVAATAKQITGKAAQIANIVMKDGGYHLRRMFQWNLQEVPLTPEEGPELASAGITDATLQRYYAWRRSLLACVLGPLVLSAILSTIDRAQAFSGLLPLGILINIVQILALWAMPGAALLGFLSWTKPRASFRWVLLGWIVGFCAPFLLAIFPPEWLFDLRGANAELAAAGVGGGAGGGVGALLGLALAINLLPVIMSVAPAIVRACVRVKTLSPGSIVPGWFLMAAAPLCVILWLVPLTALNALAGSLVLVAAVALFVAAPMWYVYNADVLTRPASAGEVARIGPVQKIAATTALAGVALLLVYMLTHSVMGRRVLGFSGEALMRPWSLDLWKFTFEYIARSMFLTAVFADVLLRVSLRVHTQLGAFKNDASSAEHEKAMESLGQVVTKG